MEEKIKSESQQILNYALRATTSFGLHLGSSDILLTSEQSTKLTLLYANNIEFMSILSLLKIY